MAELLSRQFLDTTRGRIVALLRTGGSTADDLAAKLGLTRSAVRIQLTAMERDGVVKRAGKRHGTTRPSLLFELTDEVEQLLSKAYLPVLNQLVQVFAEELAPKQLEALLRLAGRRLAEELTGGFLPNGTLESRVASASAMLNDQLGALTHVESNGKYIIRGAGCPLAALTGTHQGVCLAMESLVGHIVGGAVKQCCDRSARPRCCFEIARSSRSRARLARRTT